MQVITPYMTMMPNAEAILRMYHRVWHQGYETTPRGQLTRNVRNLGIVLFAGESIITNFEARKLNLDYCKKEWLWYLGADKFDDSIEQHAKMWLKLKQADGSFHSNYGQYIFAPPSMGNDSQFWYCHNQLLSDLSSRRASMVLLKPDHLYPENTDTVCTYAINFCIEEDALHMTVMMRSNDVIYGFTNDAFCFHQLYLMMFTLLQERYPDLKAGTYTHFSNSMHVYERHYDMIQQIVEDGTPKYTPIHPPRMTPHEVRELIATGGRAICGDYSAWLHA